MGSYKSLIKNVGLLAIGNFATKLLSFFLVPLYTSILQTEEFGIYDIFNTSVHLLVPILTIDIQEGVLRFALDKNTNKKDVFSIGAKYVFYSCLIVSFLVLGNYFTGISTMFKTYAIQFTLMYCLSSLSAFMLYFCRGIDKVFDISVSGVLSSAVMITCNIVFLVVLKMGLTGYLWATILGTAVQCIYLFFRVKLWTYYNRMYDRDMEKKILNYSKPMVLNAVSWWINNASDRYIVTYLCGVDVDGIYSASYKVPSIITTLQGIFGQAWTMSAVKDYDAEDSNGFFINVYNLLNFFLAFACTNLIMLDKVISKIILQKDFFAGWEYAPFLMISTVFAGMSTYLGGILSALKKSNSFASTSIITAIVNTILNYILISKIGPQGAAISTAFSYFLMWVLRLHLIKKDVNLRVSIVRDIFVYALLCVQATLLCIVERETIFSLYQIFFVIAILVLYRKEAKIFLVEKLLKRKKRKTSEEKYDA